MLLDDPWGPLQGAGPQVRLVALAAPGDLDAEGLDALVLQAAELAAWHPR